MDQNIYKVDKTESQCCFCLSSKGRCGLFPLNFDSHQLLAEMYNVKIEDYSIWEICVKCLNSIEKAANFGQTVKRSIELVQPASEEIPSQEENIVPLAILKTPDEVETPEGDDDGAAIPEFNNEVEIIELNPEVVDLIENDVLTLNNQFQCCACLKVFKFRFSLIRHFAKAHGRNMIEEYKPASIIQANAWVNCMEHFTNDVAAKKEKLCPRKKPHCHFCNIELNGTTALRSHYKENHREQFRQCEVCKKKFPHLVALKAHVYKCHRRKL